MKDSRAWVGAYMAYAAPIRIRMLFGRPASSAFDKLHTKRLTKVKTHREENALQNGGET